MAITKCYVLLTNYHHDKHEKNRTKRVTQMVRAAQFYTGRNIARCKHSMANEISVLRRGLFSKNRIHNCFELIFFVELLFFFGVCVYVFAVTCRFCCSLEALSLCLSVSITCALVDCSFKATSRPIHTNSNHRVFV